MSTPDTDVLAPPDPGPDHTSPALRPIVYGLPPSGSGEIPDLVASVHSSRDTLIGYAVVDRLGGETAWGSLLAGEGLSIDDASLAARSTRLQLALFSVPRPSCHFLFTGDGRPDSIAADRRSFLAAVRPLTGSGRCRIVLEEGTAARWPAIACAGLVASAVGAVLETHRNRSRRHLAATLALHLPTPLTYDVAAALGQHGFRLLAAGDDALAADADVVIVGGPLWTLGPREAAIVRAPVLVALGTTRSSLAAEETLHDRGTWFVPETIAAGGRLHALHLTEQGEPDARALAETERVAAERLTEALGASDGRPLAEALRSKAAGLAAETCVSELPR